MPVFFLDVVKKRGDGFGKGIKAAAELCGIEHMLYLFPAVYVNLDIEREPCPYLDEHNKGNSRGSGN